VFRQGEIIKCFCLKHVSFHLETWAPGLKRKKQQNKGVVMLPCCSASGQHKL
jgi:hypothetical protein